MTAVAKSQAVALPRILCVDDEPDVLAGLATLLRRRFEVVTATSGQAGLEALSKQGPFTLVMSDFAMPKMNGAEFLAQVRLRTPDSVRILLTGQASLQGTVAAVNDGGIFRFLLKPCPPDALVRALEDGVEQARLVTVDRALVERKLDAMSGHLVRAERLASLGTMACAVGHELNNVLAVFSSALDFLRDSAARAAPPAAEDIESLQQVAQNLATHARCLLRFGQAKGAPQDASGDLRASITDAIALLRTAGLLRRVEFDLALPEKPLHLPLSRLDIDQVVINLIKNSADALRDVRTRPGRIGISVALEEAAQRVVCTVRDNGAGVAAANLPFIFEPYFTTKPANEGTGLGLFVIKQIVERCGGTVSVDSQEGAGAAFTFTIPLPAPAPDSSPA